MADLITYYEAPFALTKKVVNLYDEDLNSCPVPYLPIYLDTHGEKFTVVDRDLYNRLIHPTWGKWYIHKARRGKYVRSFKPGYLREYLHILVKKLRRTKKPTPNHVVRHKNGNTMDNRSCNLVWGTRAKNLNDTPYVGD